MRASYNQRGESDKFDDGEFWRLVRNGVGYAMMRPDDISTEANREYGDQATDDDFESAVAQQVHKLEAYAEAKRRIHAKNHVPLSRTTTNLTDFLAQPANPTPMRIESLMPDAGRVVFSAPYKTTAVGKTAPVDLIRFQDACQQNRGSFRQRPWWLTGQGDRLGDLAGGDLDILRSGR